LRRQWQVTRVPLWKPRSTASRGRWPIGWTSGWTNSGAIRWNPWTVRTSRSGRWQRWWCEFPLLCPPCMCRED
jgi:hypothetical protein